MTTLAKQDASKATLTSTRRTRSAAKSKKTGKALEESPPEGLSARWSPDQIQDILNETKRDVKRFTVTDMRLAVSVTINLALTITIIVLVLGRWYG